MNHAPFVWLARRSDQARKTAAQAEIFVLPAA